ncbi:hypothetical protein cyc_04801 [Cyclospora cayetanensis]|uniref:Uncharacterized protein n=1 Tax=Cyclospora cayetanensis TaxID=88456 RepID=A0A1D3CW50_9EIME|nr:hypothetical protein cyc_04801 [Cyclospora cayetanensis]
MYKHESVDLPGGMSEWESLPADGRRLCVPQNGSNEKHTNVEINSSAGPSAQPRSESRRLPPVTPPLNAFIKHVEASVDPNMPCLAQVVVKREQKRTELLSQDNQRPVEKESPNRRLDAWGPFWARRTYGTSQRMPSRDRQIVIATVVGISHMGAHSCSTRKRNSGGNRPTREGERTPTCCANDVNFFGNACKHLLISLTGILRNGRGAAAAPQFTTVAAAAALLASPAQNGALRLTWAHPMPQEPMLLKIMYCVHQKTTDIYSLYS